MIFTPIQNIDKSRTTAIIENCGVVVYSQIDKNISMYSLNETPYMHIGLSNFIYNNFSIVSQTQDTYNLELNEPNTLDIYAQYNINFAIPKYLVTMSTVQIPFSDSKGISRFSYNNHHLQIIPSANIVIMFFNLNELQMLPTWYKNSDYSWVNNLLYYDDNIVGVYIPYINCIFIDSTHRIEDAQQIHYKYYFQLSRFKYICQIQPGMYQRTNNISAYVRTSSTQSNQVTGLTEYYTQSYTPMMSTVGLYNNQNQLLALAKLSQPIKKSTITPQTIIIQMQYVSN